MPAYDLKALLGSLTAPSSSALWDMYFLTAGFCLSSVPVEVINATMPPGRTLSRVLAKK